MTPRQTGFTVIELLVVSSIISLASSILLASVSQARVRAQDAVRISDMRTIEIALAQYHLDKGYYPKMDVWDWPQPCGSRNQTSPASDDNWCKLENELSPYLLKLPREPVPNPSDQFYTYGYRSHWADNYQTYGLVTRLRSSANFSLAINDAGGQYDSPSQPALELGALPEYCAQKYPTPPNPSHWKYWGHGFDRLCWIGN